MRVLFRYIFYAGAVLLSVGVMVGTEVDEFDITTTVTMAVGILFMIAGVIGERFKK